MASILVTQSASDRQRYFGGRAGEMLEKCGEVLWNDLERALTEEEVAARLVACEAVITGWGGCALPRQVLEQAAQLRLVGVLGGGVKAYSPEYCLQRGITICHTPRAIGRYVAEFTMGLILAFCYDLLRMDRLVRQECSLQPPEGGYHQPGGYLATGLRRTAVGIIGSGSVATHVVNFLKPYECQVMMYDPYLDEERANALGVEPCALDDLLRRSEILSVHAAWTPETEGMLSRERLALLRDGAIVVNSARMPIFDEQALLAEMKSGRLRAGLNLIPCNPIWLDPELRRRDNVLLSPGCATVARQTLIDMGEMLAEDFARFFKGQEPRQVVIAEMLPRMT